MRHGFKMEGKRERRRKKQEEGELDNGLVMTQE